jgi:DNA-binding transcriptional regulator YhcF (GntR family)
MLEIKIDTNTIDPLYQQIFEQIKHLISSGQLEPGEQIPSVRDLASWLKLNPSTVARAYFSLKQEGLVTSSRRRGTVVSEAKYDQQKIRPIQPSTVSNTSFLQNIEVTFTLRPTNWYIQKSI